MSAGCKRCKEYEKKIEQLEEDLALVKFELEQLKEKRYKPTNKKFPESKVGQDNNPKTPKKRGGLFGHIGWFRKKPKKIDKIEEISLSECPHCGNKKLKEYKEIENHIQEDIILPKVETILYRKHQYYCNKCKEVVTGKGINEIPRSYIGPIAKSLAVFLKYQIKISDRDIWCLFEKMFHLNMAHSSIEGFKEQLKQEALPIYEKLKEALKSGKFIHGDETGIRVDGQNWWRWKFANKRISLTVTDKSRGQQVVEEVLGKEYNGILITDFLSAYNKIITKGKQRCLVHLLRDLVKVVQYWYADKEVMNYCTRLKAILEEAITLHKEYKDKNWDTKYNSRREAIRKQLDDFAFPNPNKKILKRFAKRLDRYKDEMFTFLYNKGIDYHNNHAQQQIRPDVILRKITYGHRSEQGTKNHDVLMSVLQTAKLNKLDPLKVLKDIYILKKNPFTAVFASSP